MSDQFENQKSSTMGIDENSELTISGFRLKIEKQIAYGGTAIVYRGVYRDQKVAVKALIPGADATVRSFFLSECTNLRSIRNGWKQCWPEDPLVIPDLLGDEIAGAQPLIVMEWLDGTSINELLGRGVELSEFDVLQLAVQFGKLLQALHENLNKCYADVKFENLYLMNNRGRDNRPMLKVLDWNVLSDRNEERVARDLFYASIFLFRMLGRADVQYRGIRIQTRLEGMDAFKKLSSGTRRFLQMALHSNQSLRFQSAQEWTRRLCTLIEWWQQEPQQLNDLVVAQLKRSKEALEAKQPALAAQIMNDACDILDISDRKGRGNPNIWKLLNDRIQNGLQETSQLEIGKTFLAGKLFSQAADTFLKGAELSPLDPEKILRWYWLAQSAQDMGLTDYARFETEDANQVPYNRLERGLELLLAGDMPRAEEIFRQALAELQGHVPTGLKALHDEAKIYNLIDLSLKAQQAGDYDGAAKLLGEAYEIYRALPTQPRTAWVQALGDVYQLWQVARHEADTLGMAHKYIVEAEKAAAEKDWPRCAGHYQSALLAAEDNHDTVHAWQKTLEACFTAGELDAVMILSDKAFGLRGIKTAAMPIREMCQGIRSILQAAIDKKIDAASAQCLAYYQQHLGDTLALGEAFLDAVQSVFGAALQEGDLQVAGKLVEVTRNLSADRAEQMSARIKQSIADSETYRETALQQLLARIQSLHEKEKLPESIRAEELIKRFQLTAKPNDPRWENWKKYFDEVSSRHSRLQAEQARKDQENQKTIADFRNQLLRISARLEKWDEIVEQLDTSHQEDEKLLQSIDQDRLRLIRQAFEIVYQWRQLTSNDPECAKKQAELKKELDRYGLAGWEIQKEEVDQHYLELSRMVEEVRDAYERGDLERAQQLFILYRESTPKAFETFEMEQKLEEAGNFQKWANSFRQKKGEINLPVEQQSLKEWLSRKLPHAYWKNHTPDFREFLLDQRHTEVKRLLGTNDTDTGFSSALASVITVQKMIAAMDIAAGQPQTNGIPLAEVVRDARALSKNRRKKQEDGIKAFFSKVSSLDLDHPVTKDMITNEIWNQRRRQTIMRAAAGGLIGVVLLAVGFFLLKDFIITPPAPEATFTPAPTLEPTPLEPTATLTLTPTQTPEPTPTSIPVSAFLLADPTALTAVLPAGLEPLYLIDDGQAMFMPEDGFWEEKTYPDLQAYHGDLHAALQQATEDASITWSMDMPLDRPGRYELYVSIPQGIPGIYPDGLTYEVLCGDKLVTPSLGSGEVFLVDPGLKELSWKSIGIYDLPGEQPISVRLNVTGLALSATKGIFADAVLFARVAEADPQIPLVQNIINEGNEQLAFWLDNDRAILEPEEGWQSGESNPGNWNGDILIDLAPIAGKAKLVWKLDHPLLAPNEYIVQVWVSPNLSAKAVYTLTLDGKNVEGVNPLVIDPAAGFSGTRQTLGVVTIKDNKQPNLLEITLMPEEGVDKGILAGDVILVLVKK